MSQLIQKLKQLDVPEGSSIDSVKENVDCTDQNILFGENSSKTEESEKAVYDNRNIESDIDEGSDSITSKLKEHISDNLNGDVNIKHDSNEANPQEEATCSDCDTERLREVLDARYSEIWDKMDMDKLQSLVVKNKHGEDILFCDTGICIK